MKKPVYGRDSIYTVSQDRLVYWKISIEIEGHFAVYPYLKINTIKIKRQAFCLGRQHACLMMRRIGPTSPLATIFYHKWKIIIIRVAKCGAEMAPKWRRNGTDGTEMAPSCGTEMAPKWRRWRPPIGWAGFGGRTPKKSA